MPDSPPARRRGLKRSLPPLEVADAYSPPARRRGLKLRCQGLSLSQCVSPPARRRGLKLNLAMMEFGHVSLASRAEAWIETGDYALVRNWSGARLPRGGVD